MDRHQLTWTHRWWLAVSAGIFRHNHVHVAKGRAIRCVFGQVVFTAPNGALAWVGTCLTEGVSWMRALQAQGHMPGT